MYQPLLDYKTTESGKRYDFSLMFLQEAHVKAIYGCLLKEKQHIEILLESMDCQNKELIEEQHLNLCILLKIISEYEET